jgi:NAD(P)-dependent dehydrogenase (short-subunit alcohol dehydrogenase family)
MYALSGKSALVTGAGQGIGERTAFLFAERGAAVAVADILLPNAQRVANEIIANGGRAFAVEVDVADPESCIAMVKTVVTEFGSLDIAVNNAAIRGEKSTLIDQSLESWNQVIGVNLGGVFNALRAEIPAMLSCGGAIVNLASVAGIIGWEGSAAYTASKHGVVGLTQVAALEFSKHGIRINAVAPAPVMTAMAMGGTKSLDDLAKMQPLGRLADADDIARAIAFLVSDQARFITGSVYPVDGGFLAK